MLGEAGRAVHTTFALWCTWVGYHLTSRKCTLKHDRAQVLQIRALCALGMGPQKPGGHGKNSRQTWAAATHRKNIMPGPPTEGRKSSGAGAGMYTARQRYPDRLTPLLFPRETFVSTQTRGIRDGPGPSNLQPWTTWILLG